MEQELAGEFADQFREWAIAACEEWGYPSPQEDMVGRALSRIPRTIQAWVSKGLSEGIVTVDGHRFRLAGLKPGKGPYAWFSRNPATQEPNPNWEYFVQVAEFVRLSPAKGIAGVTLDFEDSLMDISVYRDGSLLVCIEVKEKAEQLRRLLDDLRDYQSGVDMAADHKGNDPLQKAKYIVSKKPCFFCGVAAGLRETYRVEFPEGKAFSLVPDFLPPLA